MLVLAELNVRFFPFTRLPTHYYLFFKKKIFLHSSSARNKKKKLRSRGYNTEKHLFPFFYGFDNEYANLARSELC